MSAASTNLDDAAQALPDETHEENTRADEISKIEEDREWAEMNLKLKQLELQNDLKVKKSKKQLEDLQDEKLQRDLEMAQLKTKLQEMESQVKNQTHDDVAALVFLKSLTKDKYKVEAKNIIQSNIPALPQHLQESVKYIAEREIEHGSQVLGYLERHISLPVVTYLINTGADGAAQGETTWSRGSILHHAAIAGELQVVQFLVLEVGVDINLRDGYKYTPLYHAAWQGKLNVVQFLLSQYCDVNARGLTGNAALNMAAYSGHLEVVKLLISHKADVNIKDVTEDTPLHDAAVKGRLSIVKYLVTEAAANVTATNIKGDTPLHKAAYSGHLPTVKYFVTEAAANVTATNNNGETPLDSARRLWSDASAVVEFLQNYKK